MLGPKRLMPNAKVREAFFRFCFSGISALGQVGKVLGLRGGEAGKVLGPSPMPR